ncbi:hypothetical protein BDY19DRAFT_992087 [Irpex rosettiformis]|uniref:Uncharacterized protein n=1 Tax=Irpex rosettiformis TaxID=378272 RepID=A0ACB8U905_9APHY|nr:hypothetical protein BDY19DRAFT_992087 [Irpex rosettiformis]
MLVRTIAPHNRQDVHSNLRKRDSEQAIPNRMLADRLSHSNAPYDTNGGRHGERVRSTPDTALRAVIRMGLGQGAEVMCDGMNTTKDDVQFRERDFLQVQGGGDVINLTFEEELKCVPPLEFDKSSPGKSTEREHMTSQPSPSRTSGATALPRGAACLPCRRRKMRCDGIRPFCGQCTSKQRTDDCEYPSDIQGLTKIQMLEENITLLETRIRELEDPNGDSSIRLYPVPAAEPLGLSPAPVPQEASQPIDGEPTAAEVKSLTRSFAQNATQAGFFLSIPHFLQMTQAIDTDSPMAHPSGPLYDPLLSTICLWGTRLSSDAALNRHENYLTACSVMLLSSSILNSDPQGHAILAVIQAEVLLANYFFSVGRLLEGRYHCGAAASLCISCRLNTLSSPNQSLTHLLSGVGITTLAHPISSVQPETVTVGERVNAFWAVYSLDTVWAIALGYASSLDESMGTVAANRPNMMISTPWPKRMADYEQGHQVVFNALDRPIFSLLNQASLEFSNTSSPPALRAQAATLFSHASRLSSRFDNAMSMTESNAFLTEFNSLDNLITRFTNDLPPVNINNSNDIDAHEILIASMLSRVAIIQLHHRLSKSQSRSRDACIQYAQTVVAAIQDMKPDIKFLDPTMAILLTAVGQVFINEIRSHMSDGYIGSQEYVDNLTKSLDTVLRVMTELGTVCPLMLTQAAQIREWRGV